MPDCGGDYHETIMGYVLQRYCINPDCKQNGLMRPGLVEKDPDYISNNQLKRFYKKLAYINNLGMEHTRKIVFGANSNNKWDVANFVSIRLHISVVDCLKIIN